MRRLFFVVACLLVATAVSQAAPLPLHRGVGVHDWLNWSPVNSAGTYRWPPYRSKTDWLAGSRPLSDWPSQDAFRRIRSMGFDFVRLSVDPGPLLDSDDDRRRVALDVLSRAVQEVTDAKLKVVFNLHSVSQVPAYDITILYHGFDSTGVASYRDMVKSVTRMLVDIGTDMVALEPFNEPAFYPCDASGSEDWQQIMAATVADIRTISTELTIVATGACGGSITGLTDIDPTFDDPNIYYSLHMYEPHSFTHQRADEANGFSSSLPWPADTGRADAVIERLKIYMDAASVSQAEQASALGALRPAIDAYFAENWGLPQMRARLDEAVGWAKGYGIPNERLFMGEFGAILRGADGRYGAANADRLRYLKALRQEAEKRDIPWSIWEYSNPHGMTVILPEGTASPDFELLEALGL